MPASPTSASSASTSGCDSGGSPQTTSSATRVPRIWLSGRWRTTAVPPCRPRPADPGLVRVPTVGAPPGEQPGECGLARAVVADDGDELSSSHGEVDVDEGRCRCTRIGETHVIESDRQRIDRTVVGRCLERVGRRECSQSVEDGAEDEIGDDGTEDDSGDDGHADPQPPVVDDRADAVLDPFGCADQCGGTLQDLGHAQRRVLERGQQQGAQRSENKQQDYGEQRQRGPDDQ